MSGMTRQPFQTLNHFYLLVAVSHTFSFDMIDGYWFKCHSGRVSVEIFLDYLSGILTNVPSFMLHIENIF
jgi:hypothetical protein